MTQSQKVNYVGLPGIEGAEAPRRHTGFAAARQPDKKYPRSKRPRIFFLSGCRELNPARLKNKNPIKSVFLLT